MNESEGDPMSAGNIIGILFSLVLFVVGMMFSGGNFAFFVIGIIGLVATIYFVVRIVSDILRRMREGNTK